MVSASPVLPWLIENLTGFIEPCCRYILVNSALLHSVRGGKTSDGLFNLYVDWFYSLYRIQGCMAVAAKGEDEVTSGSCFAAAL